MTARDPLEAACVEFLSREFDDLGAAWFHPSERANFVHSGTDRLRPKLSAAIRAYLLTVLGDAPRADLAPETPRALAQLAAELAAPGDAT